MPTSLFTAPMEQITAGDVNTFLDEELEEGPRLEYKQADPNHLRSFKNGCWAETMSCERYPAVGILTYWKENQR